MGIPAEILQKVQNYATDTVIPVYAMRTLIGLYDSTTLPTLEDVLKDTELVYLRMAPDGKTFIVNREGLVRGSFPEGGDFSLLTEVSALFDESVKVKAYYPILTTKERGAVYFRTSIGDYILYLHGKSLEIVQEGMVGTADVVPYLIPVVEFHKFAYSVVSDQKPDYGIGWTFLDERMAVIEPYKMTAVGYQKPVSLATPEAADQVKKDMEHSAVVELLGPCLRCAAESQVYTPGHPLINFSEKALEGLHYWELSDGSGVVLCCKRKSSIHYNGPNPPEYIVSVPATDIIRISSAEIIHILGTPTPATFALLREGLSESCVEALLGSPLEPSLWKCMEENVVHTVKLTWSASSSLALKIASIDYTTVSVTDAAREIEIGMSFAAISARLGTCVCGHESGTHSSQINDRYHCWTLPDGRSLAIYVGRNVPLPDSPFAQTSSTQFYGYSAMDILWLDPSNEDLSIGTPDRFLASHVQPGMRQEIVNSLMGQPSVTAASLASAWEWSENGKTYSLTVYWNDNRPTELYENFRTAARCELTEAPLSDISLAEKEPSAADAALITVGMSSIDMLRIMGSPSTLTLGDATLYRWCLVDGRVFCAVAEADLGDPLRGERFVTHTFYRDTFEDVSAPTAANMLEITEGMSVATVVALLGQPNYDTIPSTVGEPVYWVTPEGDWWDITVIFETVTHPDTGLKRAYVKSVSVNPPH
jgi:outer membrane protein assembly factor BamE (lipoprotein component of BamABCDE complex)